LFWLRKIFLYHTFYAFISFRYFKHSVNNQMYMCKGNLTAANKQTKTNREMTNRFDFVNLSQPYLPWQWVVGEGLTRVLRQHQVLCLMHGACLLLNNMVVNIVCLALIYIHSLLSCLSYFDFKAISNNVNEEIWLWVLYRQSMVASSVIGTQRSKSQQETVF